MQRRQDCKPRHARGRKGPKFMTKFYCYFWTTKQDGEHYEATWEMNDFIAARRMLKTLIMQPGENSVGAIYARPKTCGLKPLGFCTKYYNSRAKTFEIAWTSFREKAKCLNDWILAKGLSFFDAKNTNEAEKRTIQNRFIKLVFG